LWAYNQVRAKETMSARTVDGAVLVVLHY
jgi:hypothetical protein